MQTEQGLQKECPTLQVNKYCQNILCMVKTSNISANGVFAKGVPSLAVGQLSGMMTEKPRNLKINRLLTNSIP